MTTEATRNLGDQALEAALLARLAAEPATPEEIVDWASSRFCATAKRTRDAMQRLALEDRIARHDDTRWATSAGGTSSPV